MATKGPELIEPLSPVVHRYGRVLIDDNGPKIPRTGHGSVVQDVLAHLGLDYVLPNDEPIELDQVERLGLDCWRLRSSDEFKATKAQRPFDGEPWEMTEPPQPPVPPDQPGVAGSPGPPDTSAYLIGTVGLSVIFVSGPTPDLTLTNDHQVRVLAEIQEGLSRLPAHEPRANVAFAYDVKVVDIDPMPDPSLHGYEPLEALWRDPALVSLGFPTGIEGVQELAEKTRDDLGTTWSYVAFFTLYPVNWFAYAIKPYIVMNYNNGRWTPKNIDRVFQHETGHIFGAPDEYREANCNCEERYGFLQEINGNCEVCAEDSINCMMSHNTDVLCAFTPVHLGWRDSVGDGILDPLR